MSVARELFVDVGYPRRSAGDAAYEKLSRAAELWRKDGQHFSAGLAMLDACDAAWGQPDRMLEALQEGLTDFERAVAEGPPSSPASIAALYKLRQSVNRSSWFDDDRSIASTRVRELSSELGQRLFKHFKDSEHADSYLVRGVVLITDRDGMWDTRFPDYEVPSSIEHPGREQLILNIPSAFRLFVSNGEWQAAHEIVNLRREAFTTPGLRGWRAVTAAHALPAEAVTRFDEAADAFETDAMPGNEELLERGGHWSGINQQLWAKYFRARARLVESIRTPEKVKELLDQAVDALAGTESGWHSGEVSRFRVLVKVLSKLVSNPLSLDVEETRREYQLEIRISGESEEDRLALTFISEAANGFRGFATDPRSEMTRNRLGIALEALAKISAMGPEIVEAVEPEIGENALHISYGPVRSWMHRALGAITDEARLRMVLLRLLQSGLPLYAQVRHGPLEYGKDIVALIEINGVVVLRNYQVKCGDIDTRKWRESKNEMEEMFQVPLTTFQFARVPQQIEGILITNGHANPYVEPVIDGWLREQRETQRRLIQFMHLDSVVDWITRDRLVNELREALREQGIDIGEA